MIAPLVIPCKCLDQYCPDSVQFHIDLADDTAYILVVSQEDGHPVERIIDLDANEIVQVRDLLNEQLALKEAMQNGRTANSEPGYSL